MLERLVVEPPLDPVPDPGDADGALRGPLQVELGEQGDEQRQVVAELVPAIAGRGA